MDPLFFYVFNHIQTFHLVDDKKKDSNRMKAIIQNTLAIGLQCTTENTIEITLHRMARFVQINDNHIYLRNCKNIDHFT